MHVCRALIELLPLYDSCFVVVSLCFVFSLFCLLLCCYLLFPDFPLLLYLFLLYVSSSYPVSCSSPLLHVGLLFLIIFPLPLISHSSLFCCSFLFSNYYLVSFFIFFSILFFLSIIICPFVFIFLCHLSSQEPSKR